jgi:hypothetical protein
MKKNLKFKGTLTASLLLISTNCFSDSFEEITGGYKPINNKCLENDRLYEGICFPLSNSYRLFHYAAVEMNNKDNLFEYMKQNFYFSKGILYKSNFYEHIDFYKSENNMCKASKYGLNDYFLNGYCFKLESADIELFELATTELFYPEILYSSLKNIIINNEYIPESYSVEIKDYNNNTFELYDGSSFKKTDSKYLGYIGYRKKSIIYKNHKKEWKICIDGEIHEVELLKKHTYYSSRDNISNLTIQQIKKSDYCN